MCEIGSHPRNLKQVVAGVIVMNSVAEVGHECRVVSVLNVSNAILKWMRSVIKSQWRMAVWCDHVCSSTWQRAPGRSALCRTEMWKWAALYTLLTWSSKDSVLWVVTPRLFTLFTCNRNSNAGDCDVVDLCFRPLSSPGTDDNRFGFVRIQAKPVGIQPSMNGLEIGIDNAECPVSAMYSWVSSVYWVW